MPILSIACKNSPKGKEATYYAFFVSISNFFCSMANFTGYFFLNMMDVTESSFVNVNSVNILCFVWIIMVWMLSKHIILPEDFNLKVPTKSIKRKTKFKEVKNTESESEDE